jgi:DNA-binding response OmpR family regulator
MAQILLISSVPSQVVLPGLGLLSQHRVRQITPEPASLLSAPPRDLILLDARKDLAASQAQTRMLLTTGSRAPLILVVSEGGFAAMSADWGAHDLVVDSAGPAEIDARIRIAIERTQRTANKDTISISGVVIDEASYSAKINGAPLDLTYKEFELLRFLTQHSGRVFTREQLLSEVWGYDYFGGTRTVDVHVRRLRAKLGELESLIGTVRNVGYRFNPTAEEEYDLESTYEN